MFSKTGVTRHNTFGPPSKQQVMAPVRLLQEEGPVTKDICLAWCQYLITVHLGNCDIQFRVVDA